MKRLFLLMGMLAMMQVFAQHPSNEKQKLSPVFSEGRKLLDKNKPYLFFLVASNTDSLKKWLLDSVRSVTIQFEYSASNLLLVQGTIRTVESVIIPSPLVKFVDLVRKPVEETQVDGLDLSTNQINLVHHNFPTLNGSGSTVSIKENKPDTGDIDLRGRFLALSGASQTVTAHATIMATITAGAGNSNKSGKGVAWGAGITSSNFANLVPDQDNEYKQNNISVQNHSYGTGIENYYGADAAAYDASTLSNPALVHVFSSGNSGDRSSQSGRYTGITGYANLTGSLKMAKNIITVGAIDSFFRIETLSSRGPAYDGRVKPELVAFGKDGSSGAAAIVSGTALLLQQAFKETNSGQLPSSALTRAILLNSADDIGPSGPDYQSGFGSLNAYQAVKTVMDKRFIAGSITHGQQQTFSVSVPPGAQQLKITICWNDVPGAPNVSNALVNNLDIELVHPLSGQRWQPWALSRFANTDSLSKPATRGRDTINNVEQITLNAPMAGAYTIHLTAPRIQSTFQEFFIAYECKLSNQVRWVFPTGSDPITANKGTNLKWSSSRSDPSAELFLSTDKGQTWTMISPAVSLNQEYFYWKAPGINGRVLLKLFAGGESYISDTILVSTQPEVKVGYNCADSFSLYWNKVTGASSYTVYGLGDKYLERFRVISDTSIIVKKSLNNLTHFSVAANMEGYIGPGSTTLNYTTQGVGCYLRNFLVDLNNNAANIQFELGTVFDIQTITLEKAGLSGYGSIHTITTFDQLRYNYSDPGLSKGVNRYRLRITLKNGQSIYSSIETIYHLAGSTHIVYPNPTKSNFKVISQDPDNSELLLFTAPGQCVLRKRLTSPVQDINIIGLQKGLYFLMIRQNGSKVYGSKMIVQ